MYFESTNEFDDRLGITTAKRGFSYLLSHKTIAELTKISVSIEPDSEGVEKILATPNLQKIELRINRPNGDTTSSATRRRVLAQLEAAGATQLDEVWVARGQGNNLKISQSLSEHAHVGAETGFLRAEALGKGGGRIKLSSDEMPRRYLIGLASGETLFQRLRASFRNIV